MQTNKQQPGFEIANDKILQTDHSLSADLAMGWRPKLKVIGPIPLNFDNPYIDKAIKELLKSQASIYSVIYLGPRPSNTFKMHQIIKKKYKYKYQHLFSVEYGHLKAFFHKFYSEFQQKMKIPFLGMNPIFKSHKLTFDSCFQSGNLDCVVKVGEAQYDLILRIDSNTAGHIMWYYFKVTNNEQKNHKIKFNIVNLRRNKSCYQRGMKPFIRRKKKANDNENQTIQQWSQWQQGGINVEVSEQKLRFAKQTIVFNGGMVGIQQPQVIFRRLSFQVQFEPLEEMQFAYCVPYTYSDIINDIKEWKQSITDRGVKNIHFSVDMSNESLSGLEIPLIKITEKQSEKYDEENQKNKQSIFIIGRQHPGESNGSWVTKGLISQLLDDNPQIRFLRKHIVFTIIPMLNVDGVVLGNFRTSLYGKDLNRLFRKQQLFLIPEVELCKQEFNQLMKVFKTKIMLFLDIHGHSARRNAFCYGPGILDSNSFNDVRQFAKIIASRTQIFRYPSCSFRIQHDKKTTARACFSKSVRVAYTIESSNWSFYSRSMGKMIDFTSQYWQTIGFDIVDSLAEYAQDKISKNKSKSKKNKNKNNEVKNTVTKINEKRSLLNGGQFPINTLKSQMTINDKQSPQKKKIKRAQTTKQIAEGNEKKVLVSQKAMSPNKTHTDKLNSQRNSIQKQPFIRQTLSKSSKYLKMQQIEQQQNESDKMSDNEMDSDTQGEDMQRSKFERLMNGAKRMMIEFEKVYWGDQYEKKGRTAAKLRQEKLKLAHRQSRNIKKNSQVLACLRKKQPAQQSQQQIQLITNHNRSPQNTKSKQLSQPHRKSNQPHALPLNTKQIQFQYEATQQEPIARQIMLVNHKAQYQKILLPRIQQSYQSKRKRQYLQGTNFAQQRNLDEERVQKWTSSQVSPQLAMIGLNEDQQGQYPSNKVNKSSNRSFNIRHKSISAYERSTRNNRVDFYKNNEQKQQQQNSDDGQLQQQKSQNYQQQQNQQFQQQKNKDLLALKHRLKRRYVQQHPNNIKNDQQQDDQIQHNIHIHSITSRQNLPNSPDQSINNAPILRYSMKMSPTHPSKQSMLTKTKRQLQQIKKIQLIEKLSDPISKGYRQNIVSFQQLKNPKNKIVGGYVQIEGFSVAKKGVVQKIENNQQSRKISQNNNKIKEIILNNLQDIKDNKKSYTRAKKQKPKLSDQKQKFSIEAMPITSKGQDLRDSLIQSLENKTTKNIMEFSVGNKNLNSNSLSPYKNSNLLHIEKSQQSSLISASVILPRHNPHKLLLQTQKIRTLQSQNLMVKQSQQQGNEVSKGIKNVLSATRNYSQREKQKDTQLVTDILRQEERMNYKAMKFGGDSLPKLGGQKQRQKQRRSPQKQFSKTKISLYKPIDAKEKQSPIKGERLIRMGNNISKQLTSAQLIHERQKQRDFPNIKLIINNNNNHSNNNNNNSNNNNNNSNNINNINNSNNINNINNHSNNINSNNDSNQQIKKITTSTIKSSTAQLQHKNSNRQMLLNRLKQLQAQQQGRQKFGQANLFIGKINNIKNSTNTNNNTMTNMTNINMANTNMTNNPHQSMPSSQSATKKIKTHTSQYQQLSNDRQLVAEQKKQLKIFSLPTNKYNLLNNNNNKKPSSLLK